MKQGLDITTKALALCAGAFLFGSPAWGKDEPLVLKQSDKWVANFDTESCQLITAFGDGDDKVLVRFSRYAPGDTFQLDLFGAPFGESRKIDHVKFKFGPNGAQRDVHAATGTSGGMPMIMLGQTDFLGQDRDGDKPLPLITPEQEKQVGTLDVSVQFRRPLRLQLGSMARPMKVMRTCMDTLIRSWGFDPDTVAIGGQSATPRSNPERWLTTSDYPLQMLAKGGQGIVRFRLEVDETGKVSGCHIQQRTNPDAFADLSCKLLTERARFIPTHDASGKAVKGMYINSVRWVIPSL